MNEPYGNCNWEAAILEIRETCEVRMNLVEVERIKTKMWDWNLEENKGRQWEKQREEDTFCEKKALPLQVWEVASDDNLRREVSVGENGKMREITRLQERESYLLAFGTRAMSGGTVRKKLRMNLKGDAKLLGLDFRVQRATG